MGNLCTISETTLLIIVDSSTNMHLIMNNPLRYHCNITKAKKVGYINKTEKEKFKPARARPINNLPADFLSE